MDSDYIFFYYFSKFTYSHIGLHPSYTCLERHKSMGGDWLWVMVVALRRQEGVNLGEGKLGK